MSEPMSRETLLANLAERYTELDDLIAQLSEEQLAFPGVTEEWSVRDMLAHLTWWQQWALARMHGESSRIHKEPGESDEMFWQRVNAVAIAEVRGEPTSKVLADFRASHQQMMQMISVLTDAQLANEKLIGNIIGITYEHYEEHLPMLRAFVERQSIL
jgi:uncharacterized protein (TIGR03083 family)